MWQILGLLMAAALAVVIFKLALIAVFIAGLIFRTKETLGVLAFLVVWAGFRAHPVIGISIACALTGWVLYRKHVTRNDPPAQLPKPDE